MNKTLKPAIVVLLVILAVGAMTLFSGSGGGKEIIPWRTDLAVARAEAARTHRNVLIDFTASWCGPCQNMRRGAWSDPAVAAALGNVIPVQIDVDQHGDIAQEFGVNGIPNLVLLDEKGAVLKTNVGFMSPGEFIAWLGR
ncbi:MAG TPA: thioredoxin family protein [Humisphaera sp.]|nr:thioredoxin family protein [Humisphaera sp.]